MSRIFSAFLTATLMVTIGPSHALAQAALGEVGEGRKINYSDIGNDRTTPIKVNDAIYQAVGFGNTFLVTTSEGNVIIDTSTATTAPRHKEMLTKVSAAPVRYIVLTHGHGDHAGGVGLWKQDGTQIVTHRNFPEFRAYQDRLGEFFARNNAAQFNYSEAEIRARQQAPKVVPTITFNQQHNFSLGGLDFEVHATPGETPDHISVWLPKYKAAFIGDNVYDSFPNIYTLRGTTPRWALDYIASINKVLSWKPEIVLPSHGEPIVGNAEIVKRLTRYRDAIQYVHDATVKGMNDGKDVFTLMREIKLPPELEMGETYGKVSWSVRGIYEGYIGWFDRNPATMYGYSPNVAEADLVALAGGATPVAAKAREAFVAGETVKALRLADAALAADPQHRAALDVKIDALKKLQTQTRNGLEQSWLDYGIRTAEQAGKVTGDR